METHIGGQRHFVFEVTPRALGDSLFCEQGVMRERRSSMEGSANSFGVPSPDPTTWIEGSSHLGWGLVEAAGDQQHA